MKIINSYLADKSYILCQGSIPPLGFEEVSKSLKELENGWKLNELSHLYKKHIFPDSMDSMRFANKTTKVAEEKTHDANLKASLEKYVKLFYKLKRNKRNSV